MQLAQRDQDTNLKSLLIVSGRTNKINNIFNKDLVSIASSVVNLANNTQNHIYHHEDTSNLFKSSKEADIKFIMATIIQ